MRLPNKVYFIREEEIYSLEIGDALAVAEKKLKREIFNIRGFAKLLNKKPRKQSPWTFDTTNYKAKDWKELSVTLRGFLEMKSGFR